MSQRQELIKAVATRCDYSKYEVEDVLLALEYVIRNRLVNGESVKFGELFTVSPKQMPIRNYKDFTTGEIVKSSPKRKLEINPSAFLLSELNKEV